MQISFLLTVQLVTDVIIFTLCFCEVEKWFNNFALTWRILLSLNLHTNEAIEKWNFQIQTIFQGLI
jgi:hypothetical protein